MQYQDYRGGGRLFVLGLLGALAFALISGVGCAKTDNPAVEKKTSSPQGEEAQVEQKQISKDCKNPLEPKVMTGEDVMKLTDLVTKEKGAYVRTKTVYFLVEEDSHGKKQFLHGEITGYEKSEEVHKDKMVDPKGKIICTSMGTEETQGMSLSGMVAMPNELDTEFGNTDYDRKDTFRADFNSRGFSSKIVPAAGSLMVNDQPGNNGAVAYAVGRINKETIVIRAQHTSTVGKIQRTSTWEVQYTLQK